MTTKEQYSYNLIKVYLENNERRTFKFYFLEQLNHIVTLKYKQNIFIIQQLVVIYNKNKNEIVGKV